MPLKTEFDQQPTLNLTPMIDIVFLLIIFFMVGTKFSELERKIKLSVPEIAENGALTATPEKKVVNVYQDGQITLGRRRVTLDQLTYRLSVARGQYQDLGVLIRGDGSGRFQRVAEVLGACRKAGIAELAISVKLSTVKR